MYPKHRPQAPASYINKDKGLFFPINKIKLKRLEEKSIMELGEKRAIELIEEINNLYVATTRARHELYIYVPDKIGNRINPVFPWLKSVLGVEEESYVLGKEYTRIPKKEKKEEEKLLSIDTIDLPLNKNWERNIKRTPPELKTYSPEELKNLSKGTYYHAVLQQIEYINDPEEDVKKAVAEVWNKTGRAFDRDEMEKTILDFLSQEEVRKFFEPTERVEREMEVIDKDGKIYRMDRVYFEGDTITIIDFKTTLKENLDDYKEQIKNYGRIMKEIYPEKEIKLVLLGVINPGEIEYVKY